MRRINSIYLTLALLSSYPSMSESSLDNKKIFCDVYKHEIIFLYQFKKSKYIEVDLLRKERKSYEVQQKFIEQLEDRIKDLEAKSKDCR
ncbi:hypothetical protein HYX17_03380 [Candidatus Woesearchaeota archaeon]|nr:hypothetical protein [Candidatus Woesearchaeota archaeon]